MMSSTIKRPSWCVQHAVTFAAGLAAEGMIPVCAIYSSFLQRGYDQIVHDVALQKLPVRALCSLDGATFRRTCRGMWQLIERLDVQALPRRSCWSRPALQQSPAVATYECNEAGEADVS